MLPLSNPTTAEVAMVIEITGSADSLGLRTQAGATGGVYASARWFAAAAEPTRLVELPPGLYTYNTATAALHAALGEGWVLEEAQLLTPLAEVVVGALPEWVQPTGAQDAYALDEWVQRDGLNYVSLLDANVWPPTPESNFWRLSPDPGPLPWRRPTGAGDAYAIGDRVTHTVAGRDTDLWESNIAANVTEPGTDGTFDRWWRPITDAGGEVLPWVQPMPGTANAPYEVGARVLYDGQEWVNIQPLNVWQPGVFGWEVAGVGFVAAQEVQPTKKQKLAAKRARAKGKFRGDDPATPDVNEAWLPEALEWL